MLVPFSELKIGERGEFDFGYGHKSVYVKVDQRFFNRMSWGTGDNGAPVPPGGILVDCGLVAYFHQDDLMVTKVS